MRYVHNGHETPTDARYAYHWKILETALEKTRDAYGSYVLEAAPAMTEQRQRFELQNNSGRLTVMYLGTTLEMEQTLVPVRIPVDRNLGGYCVLLIQEARQAEFDRVQQLDDLRHFSFGLGLGWLDVDVFRANDLRVVTGSSYDGLFEMLENGRFDAFPRGAIEVNDEYATRHARMPDLAVERQLLLYYPMPMYFWFANTADGRRLAARAEDGMLRMLADGSYARIFADFEDRKIRDLNLRGRRMFRIANPLLSAATPFADRRLWFDPRTYRLRPR